MWKFFLPMDSPISPNTKDTSSSLWMIASMIVWQIWTLTTNQNFQTRISLMPENQQEKKLKSGYVGRSWFFFFSNHLKTQPTTVTSTHCPLRTLLLMNQRRTNNTQKIKREKNVRKSRQKKQSQFMTFPSSGQQTLTLSNWFKK